MHYVVGNCPHCGAPIWSPMLWHGATPPPHEYSCFCRAVAPPRAPYRISWPASPFASDERQLTVEESPRIHWTTTATVAAPAGGTTLSYRMIDVS